MSYEQNNYIDMTKVQYKNNNKINWDKVVGLTLKFIYWENIRDVKVLAYEKKPSRKIVFQFLDTNEITSRSTAAFFRGCSKLNELPKYLEYDWELAAAKHTKLNFVLNDVKGVIEIINVNKNNVTFIYNEKSYNVPCSAIPNLQFYKQISGSNDFKYSVGAELSVSHGKIIILEQVYIPNGKYKQKGYKYKCLECGEQNVDSETHLNKNVGCSVCANRTIVKGINDFASFYPNLAANMTDSSLACKIGVHYDKRVEWKCPSCGFVFFAIPNNVIKTGFNCPMCSNKKSIPEKVMGALLEHLGEKVEYQKVFNWSNNVQNLYNDKLSGRKIYDFYIPRLNMIIETHGEQHYSQRDIYNRGFVLEKENDLFKKEIAKLNGIDFYIEIDCRRSEFDYLKKSIISSQLSDFFDFESINWSKVFEYAQKNITNEIVNEYNLGIKLNKIALKFEISVNEVRNCLKNASTMGLCSYLSDIKERKNRKKNIITLYKEGKSIEEIVEIVKIPRDSIVRNIRNASDNKVVEYKRTAVKQKEHLEKIKKLYNGNVSIKDISIIIGISSSTVTSYIKKLIKDGELQSRESNEVNLKENIIKLHSSGTSIRKISSVLHISQRKISDILKKAKNNGEYYYEDSNERDSRLKEESLILKKEGKSIKEIAEILGSSHKKITSLLK